MNKQSRSVVALAKKRDGTLPSLRADRSKMAWAMSRQGRTPHESEASEFNVCKAYNREPHDLGSKNGPSRPGMKRPRLNPIFLPHFEGAANPHVKVLSGWIYGWNLQFLRAWMRGP
jgi:hypothetical protein